ncbi:MAG: matrixin family metalloprotease, partial [Acidobacteriota bacterium]
CTVDRALALALLGLLVATLPAAALRYVPIDDATLLARAERVVQATVVAVDALPVTGTMPGREWQLRVDEVLIGAGVDAGDVLRLRVPGGVRPDGWALQLSGTPRAVPGDQVIAFLTPRRDGTWAAVELTLGVFHLRTGDDGTVLAVRDLRDMEAIAAVPPLAPNASTHHHHASGHHHHASTHHHHATSPAEPLRHAERFRRWLRAAARIASDAPPPPVDYRLGAAPADPTALDGLVAPGPLLLDGFTLLHSPTTSAPFGCGPVDGGHPVRWFIEAEATQAWAIDPQGEALFEDVLFAGGLGAFANALNAWSQVLPFTLESAGPDSSARGGLSERDEINALLFDDPDDLIPGRFEGSGLLALGGPWFLCDDIRTHDDARFHVAVEADIVVQEGIEDYFAASEHPEAAAAELFGHELGHALGLGHSGEVEALMAADVHNDGRGASLHADDLAGARMLYTAVGATPGPPPGDPPDAPDAPDAAGTASDRIALTWTEIDGVSGYRLERSPVDDDDGAAPAPDDASWRLIGGVAASGALGGPLGVTVTYDDIDLAPDTAYAYRLRVDTLDGFSPPSAPVVARTLPLDLPSAPRLLRGAPLAADRVQLTWQDTSDDETGFQVEGHTGSVFLPIGAPLPPGHEAVEISGLQAGVTRMFRVRALGVEGASPPSNTARVAPFPAEAGCVVDGRTLCLLGGRYAVRVAYRNQYDGGSEGAGAAVASTDQTGLFWFFDEANIELIVKMIDGSANNGHAWLFYGALSDVEYEIEVEDTATGTVRIYRNPPGNLCGDADTRAFARDDLPAADGARTTLGAQAIGDWLPDARLLALPTTPASEPRAEGATGEASCIADAEHLCLLGDRFSVEVDFRNQYANDEPGRGQAIPGGDNTGYFWFFGLDNTELVVKMLDGRGLTGHYWLFYGALTDVAYTITVRDTITGAVRFYESPPGSICGRSDTFAFADDAP